MTYRKVMSEARKAARGQFRDSPDWSKRIVGPKAMQPSGRAKTSRTPNLAPFREPEGPERNEGSKEKRTSRILKKEQYAKRSLKDKRGKP